MVLFDEGGDPARIVGYRTLVIAQVRLEELTDDRPRILPEVRLLGAAGRWAAFVSLYKEDSATRSLRVRRLRQKNSRRECRAYTRPAAQRVVPAQPLPLIYYLTRLPA
jgi:hypothetical protein